MLFRKVTSMTMQDVGLMRDQQSPYGVVDLMEGQHLVFVVTCKCGIGAWQPNLLVQHTKPLVPARNMYRHGPLCPLERKLRLFLTLICFGNSGYHCSPEKWRQSEVAGSNPPVAAGGWLLVLWGSAPCICCYMQAWHRWLTAQHCKALYARPQHV